MTIMSPASTFSYNHLGVLVLAGALLSLWPGPAPAQTVAKLKPPRSANVQAGTVASVDPAAGTITLRVPQGASMIYRITDKTQMLRAKRAAEADAFRPGESVVVRFRR